MRAASGVTLPAPARPQVSPAERNSSETLCSLKFAERVRSVELGPVSRKAELASWPSQEQLEVTQGPPVLIPLAPERGGGVSCSVPRVVGCWCPPGAIPAEDHCPARRALAPGSGTQPCHHLGSSKPCFAAALRHPRNPFGHRSPAKAPSADEPSPVPSLPSG